MEEFLCYVCNARFDYKFKYIILVAAMAPQKLKKLATLTTAVVVPDSFTMVPIQIDKIN